jgi:hypothetical protein
MTKRKAVSKREKKAKVCKNCGNFKEITDGMNGEPIRGHCPHDVTKPHRLIFEFAPCTTGYFLNKHFEVIVHLIRE